MIQGPAIPPRLTPKPIVPSVFVFAILIALANFCVAGDLREFRFDSKPGYTRFVAEFTGGFSYKTIDEQASKGYFYIDIKGVNTSPGQHRSLVLDDDRVKTALVRPYINEKILRFVFNTKGRLPIAVSTIKSPNRLIIDLYDVGKKPRDATHKPSGSLGVIVGVSEGYSSSPKPAPRIAPQAAAPAKPSPGFSSYSRARSSAGSVSRSPGRFRVVIDPGHGAHSKGAQSRYKVGGRTILEKDQALAIALELKRLLDADPTIEGVFTRTTDKYLSLEERVEFTERYRPDLFLSIHLNSIPKTSKSSTARGIEFWTLNGEGQSRLEERILSKAGGDRSRARLVARSMKRHAKTKVSALVSSGKSFARDLERETSKIGYFSKYNRGQKSENFWVLKNAYAASALVEVCFLSNRTDTEFIVQKKNRQAVARALYQAIKSHRNKYSR